MNRLLYLCVLITLSTALFAQAPKKMNYQGIARDAQGVILANQTINLRLHLISGEDVNEMIYTEEQNVTTTSFGLFSVKIGEGQVTKGDFSSIEWGNADHFIAVELDAHNNGHFEPMGVSQLLSVPYAFYAEKAGLAKDVENGGSDRAIDFIGTFGQTIRHNGTDWEASSVIHSAGEKVGINNQFPTVELDITGSLNLSRGNEFTIDGNKALAMDGNRNIMMGVSTGQSITSGANNNFIGHQAGKSTTTGINNSIIGYQAGLNNTTGDANIFYGYKSGYGNTTGSNNYFIGLQSGYGSTTGVNNVAVGTKAGYNLAGGKNNTMLGRESGYNTMGDDNVAVGYQAGDNNTTGTGNTYLGTGADGSPALTNATAIGKNAYVGQSNSVVLGNNANVGVGTGSPQQKLHVVGNARVTGAYIDSNNDAGSAGEVLASTGTGTEWVSTSSLVGPAGPTGADGAAGAVGATGATGAPGAGITGVASRIPYFDGGGNVTNDYFFTRNSTSTIMGNINTTTYNGAGFVTDQSNPQWIYVNGGSTYVNKFPRSQGTNGQVLSTDGNGNLSWVTKVGPAGPAGPTGAQGAMGNMGPIGPTGNPGVDGATGADGVTGAQGPTGAMGAQGPTGDMGPAGPSGADGAVGPTGAEGATGAQGPTGANGAPGPIGPMGYMGPTGADGAVGATGAQGPTGADGAVGATGAQGPTGADGAVGATGAQGPTGANGAPGPIGPMGYVGPTGADGAVGATGATGADGATGAQGPTGPSGDPASDDQTLSLQGDSLFISGGNMVHLSSIDNQTLSIIGDSLLSISGGNSVLLPVSSGGGSSNWTLDTTGAIYNNNGGTVGIGTTAPTASLHVQGSMRVANGTQGAGKVMVSDANGNTSWQSVQTTNTNHNVRDPFTGLNYIIATTGTFPSHSSGSTDNNTIGTVQLFAGNFAPAGWAFCHGQLLQISQNPALFSIIGTMYGGDGRYTFGLPDLRARVVVGVGNGPGLTNIREGELGGQQTITTQDKYSGY